MERQQWQPWLVGAVGLWLIASPYVLGVPFADEVQAGAFRWSFVGPGALVLLLAIGGLAAHQTWETGLAGVVGLWLLVSPWITGFSNSPAALLSAVGAGATIVTLGVWAMVTDLSGRQT